MERGFRFVPKRVLTSFNLMPSIFDDCSQYLDFMNGPETEVHIKRDFSGTLNVFLKQQNALNKETDVCDI